ncbi:MAG: 5-formyltetrahydrofolate cyclo-ligase [Proteobacteria bacterium]|nr:5-formyltetrahydrofolate cyclo-ligase [Pseudomonadota bacterium]
MENAQTKESLRRHLLKARNALDAETVKSLSARIEERLAATLRFASARTVALYSEHAGEVMTGSVLQRALELGKEVYYPVISGKSLTFHRVRAFSELTVGAYSILTPSPLVVAENPAAIELDIAILPGVAFDEAGTRIGFGKGYYDRALSELKVSSVVALAYEFQIVSGWIPTESHDAPMSLIVTEERIIDLTGATSGT